MEKQEIQKIRDYPVMKSNEMIQNTSFLLDKQEYNLLQFIISKIKPEDTEIKPITLSLLEYCNLCNIQSKGSNYDDIKSSLKALADKSVWFKAEDGGEQLVRWIEDPYVNKGDGIVKVELKKIWHKHLLELKEYYTRIDMNVIIPMKSIYGKRMYELLMSYLMNPNGTYSKTFELTELKEKMLGKEEAQIKYKDYKNFKAKVIKPALKDIENYGILDIEMKEKKYGKSVGELQFIIKVKDIKERLLAGQLSMNFFEEKV